MEEQVRSIISKYLQPLIQADGGDVEVVGIEGSRVFVRLTGTCVGCPGKSYTLGDVLEATLRSQVDPSIEVVHADSLQQ